MSHKPSLKSKEIKKEHIVNKAFEFFSKNGITGTRIDDITNAIGIAKGTFYLYFKSKRDLLMDCIEHLTHTAIPEEVWEDIRRETDYIRRFEKRLTAFLKAFSTFSGSLNLLRSCFQSNDPGLAKKANDTYRMLVNPLRKDLHWAIEHEVVQKVDEEVLSFLLWGIGEGIGHLLMMDPRYSIKDVVKISMDFMSKGIPLSEAKRMDKPKTEHFYWDVTDCKSLKIQLRNINFNEKNYFFGGFGSGELRIPLENITSIVFHQNGSQISSIVSLKSGENVTLDIDWNTSLSGESEFGQYVIGLKHVSGVSLVFTENDGGSEGVEGGI